LPKVPLFSQVPHLWTNVAVSAELF